MLGRVGLPGFWDEEAHFLVGPSPLGVELTVVAERHLDGRARKETREREREVSGQHNHAVGETDRVRSVILTSVHRT